MFDGATVAIVAAAVDAGRGARHAASPDLVPVERHPSTELPLSYAQEALWFLDQLVPAGSFYNMPSAYRLAGPLDVDALERAVNAILTRHESLRTTFPATSGRPRQEITPFAPIPLEVEDLRALGATGAEREARRRAAGEAAQPFDLGRGPVWRSRLLRIGPDDHVLLLTVHHIASDAWSSLVVRRELAAAYGGSPLPPLPVQYADYAVWQRRRLEGEPLERDLAFWHANLAGAAPALELPPDRLRPATPTYRGAIETFGVPAAVARSLRASAGAAGATLYMALLAAFDLLLARATGRTDILVAGTVAGRDRGEVEDLVGLFANTVVLRTAVPPGDTFDGLLGRVRRTVLDALEHRDAPFDRVVERVKPPRDTSRNPLVQVAFDFYEHVETPTRLGDDVELIDLGGHTGAEFAAADGEGVAARLDVELFVAENADRSLAGTLVYATDLYDRATMVRFARDYCELVGTIAREHDGHPG
jgi:hypothetical protein